MVPARDKYSLARAYEGRTFGAYRIARAIGTGGMATVFLARRTGPGRFAQTAALKVIHPHLAHEREFVEMFLEEARLASSINHPNVCRVLDFGQAEGTFYLAMEYVRGETWATSLERLTSLRESRMRLHALSTYVIGQACEGLHAVHEAVDPSGIPLNIVHRDISPQNLFVAYDGSVRVLDFGVASAASSERGASSTTQVVKGRYAYMAPEQVRGAEVDRRADIWSLGVCLREALSGQRLFERDTQVATILAVTKEPFPPWPKHVPLLLQEVCNRALSADPDQRYATAREFGSALARVAASDSEPASGAELSRWMRTLFPEKIAKKRDELRELAGDAYTTGGFTSIIPKVGTAPGFAGEAQGTRQGGTQLRNRLVDLSRWILAFALSLGAAYLAFRLTPRLLSRQPKTPAVATTQADQKPVVTSLAKTEQPVLAKALAPNPDPGQAREASEQGQTALPPEDPAARTDGMVTSSRNAGTEQDESENRTHHQRRHAPEERASQREHGVDARGSAREQNKDAAEESSARAKRTVSSPSDVTPSAAASAPGTLVVGATSGWAEVTLGGKSLGTTPFRVDLPAGKHRLDVRFFGTGTAQPVQVDVQPGEITKLRLSQ